MSLQGKGFRVWIGALNWQVTDVLIEPRKVDVCRGGFSVEILDRLKWAGCAGAM